MSIESGPESSYTQIMDIVGAVLGQEASVIAMDDDHTWFQIQFIFNEKHAVLDIGLAPPNEVTSTMEYEFKKLVIGNSKNLFLSDELMTFCEWGMKFEKGRLKLLLIRLEGFLGRQQLESDAMADIYLPATDRVVLAETLHSAPVLDELDQDTPNDAPVTRTSTIESSRWHHPAAKIGIIVGFAVAGGSAGYFLFNQSDQSAGAVSSASSATLSYPAPAPFTQLQRTTQSNPAPTRSDCLTINVAATGTEHGLLPWLRTIQHAHPAFFSAHHLTPQVLVTATIRPRHRAEALAHEQTNTLHVIGEQHHYHFGRVVPGDQISLQACPDSPATMSYSRGSIGLYRVEFGR